MAIEIKSIDFEVIYTIWKNYLWLDRKSPIETHSAMLHLYTEYDAGNFALPVWFLGCFVDNILVGVNSGHMCTDGSARSRGLWVSDLHRNQGYGKNLLISTIDKSKENNALFVWSMPRKSAWQTYKSAGFILTSDWFKTETSESNAYCYLPLI